MKILVTGAGGFLGGRIGARLNARGARDLRLHYRRGPAEAERRAVEASLPDSSVEVLAGNLVNPEVCDALTRGVDILVHVAAGMRGAAADMFLNTVVATQELLDSAARHGVRRAVLVSSFAVYRTVDLPSGAVVDEQTPLEPRGIEKGVYAFVKTRQEQLFAQSCARLGLEAVVLRPGVIYGPGGPVISARVGLKVFGRFLSLGGSAVLPLTHVDSCADAVALAALHAPAGATYNVVDDDLPTCAAFLSMYRRSVEPLKVLRVPYFVLMYGATWVARYHHRSRGQLPAVFTPYLVRSMYRNFSYSNARLKSLGWQPAVPTAKGLKSLFDSVRKQTTASI